MLGWAAFVGPGLASWEVSVLVHPSRVNLTSWCTRRGKARVEVDVGLGQGMAGIPKALCPDPVVQWGHEGCLSLILAKHLLLFVGMDYLSTRQETTLQTSHWTLTVSPSHTLHVTPKADRASSQPNLLSGSHQDFGGP